MKGLFYPKLIPAPLLVVPNLGDIYPSGGDPYNV
jgi:hypothetical protein